MAQMHSRLQEERARHASLATELRYFARQMDVADNGEMVPHTPQQLRELMSVCDRDANGEVRQ